MKVRATIRFTNVLRHALRHKKAELGLFILIIFFVFLVVVYLRFCNNSFPAAEVYGHVIDPIISITTALIAIFIYYKQLFDDWVKSLPLKLTVHFVKDSKYVMTCHKALLVSESDIRNWTQQIGMQMNNGEHLHFKPFFNFIKRGEIEMDQKGSYRHYEVIYYLSFLPGEETDKKDKDGKPTIAKGNNDLRSKYLVWWDNDPDTEHNENVFFDEQPNKPKSIEQAIEQKKKQLQTIQ